MRHTRFLLALAAAPLTVFACDTNGVTPPNESVDVTVSSAGFSPQVLTVEPADSIAGGEGSGFPLTVQWSFADGPHNITFEAGASSETLPSGSTFERDFTDAVAGVYRYRCTLHSSDFVTGEVGQVVVIN